MILMMKSDTVLMEDADVFVGWETRDKLKASVYELRLSTLTEIYKSKLAELDHRTREVLKAIPDNVKHTKIANFD